jgi:hypothetical protein
MGREITMQTSNNNNVSQDLIAKQAGDGLAQDRRSQPRAPQAQLACKVFHPASGRYIPAVMHDASTNGALIEIQWPNAIAAGEELLLFVASERQTLLRNSDAITASVRRVLRTERATTLGLALTGNLLFPLPAPANKKQAA